MNISSDQQASLGWQAYLYTVDQMSAAERAAFEERLDVDQQAREMVAQVVQLTHTLATLPVEAFDPHIAAPHSPVDSQRLVAPASNCDSQHWQFASWQKAGWMAVGAAACWALLATWGAVDRGGHPRFDLSTRPVVLAWTEYTGQQGDSADETGAELADDRSSRPIEVANDAEPELAAPDWLFSAMNLADEADTASAESPANNLLPGGNPESGDQPSVETQAPDVRKSAGEKK